MRIYLRARWGSSIGRRVNSRVQGSTGAGVQLVVRSRGAACGASSHLRIPSQLTVGASLLDIRSIESITCIKTSQAILQECSCISWQMEDRQG